jgi:SAM-dependent methyltransferase
MPEIPVRDSDAFDLVRASYDQIADGYLASVLALPVDHRIGWTQRLLTRLTSSSRVLEIGCGAGLPVGALIFEAGHQLTGIDLSPRQVELATRNIPQAAFQVGNATEATFADQSFDAIVMLYTIGHIPRERLPKLCADFSRWLVPGGHLLITLTMNDSESWVEENFLGLGVTSWTNGYPPDTVLDFLKDAGFMVRDRETLLDADGGSWLWMLAERRQLR